jgi:hypothetical protein
MRTVTIIHASKSSFLDENDALSGLSLLRRGISRAALEHTTALDVTSIRSTIALCRLRVAGRWVIR